MRLAYSLAAGLLFAFSLTSASSKDGFGRLEGHGGPIQSLAVSPDGKRALSASFDYAAGLWDLESETLIRWLDGHEAAVNTAAFSQDGGHALTAGDDFSLILWDVGTGEALHRFKGHRGKVLTVAISPDQRTAASAGWDGLIGLWDIVAHEPLGFLDGHKGMVNAVAFSGDGDALWSASYDGAIRLWRRDGEGFTFDRIVVSHGFGVNLIVINEDAGWIAYGALDGAVRVLSIDTAEEIVDVTSGRQPVLGLTLSADGQRLAISDGEGFIHVVSTETWTTIKDFRAVPRGPVWALAFTADGERVLAGGLDDFVNIWPVDEAASVAEADATGQRFHANEGLSNGARQFARKCSVCHTLEPDGRRRAGPTLHRLFGRQAGSVEGYAYSEALERAEIVWTDETVDKLFDLGPDHYTPGSKMPMQQIARPEDRADLIAFLKTATEPQAPPEAAAERP